MTDFDFRFVHFNGKTGQIRQLATSAFAPGALGEDVEVAEIIGDVPVAADIGNWKVDLASVSDGACSLIELSADERFVVPLDGVKVILKAEIDTAAERQRRQYMTPGALQGAVYQAKGNEVTRWREDDKPAEPDPEGYRWAAARAERRGVSVHEVLTEWSARSTDWEAIGIAIEDVREGTKEKIDAAKDEAAARAIVAAVTWPSP